MSPESRIWTPENVSIDRRSFLRGTAASALAASMGMNASAEEQAKQEFTKEDMLNHLKIGEVQWVTAKELKEKVGLDCIDGRRDDACIAATPGGDMGDLFLKLSAFEQISQREISPDDVPVIFKEYFAGRAAPYLHSDDHALTNVGHRLSMVHDEHHATEDELAKIREMLTKPGKRKDAALEALLDPDGNGCGHVKLMLKNPKNYPGDRPELLKQLLKTYHETRWNGASSDYVVLHGEHQEQAVVQVKSGKDIKEKSMVPLIKPFVVDKKGKKSSVFPIYPEVESLSEESFLDETHRITGIRNVDVDRDEFAAKMHEMRGKYLAASANALAKGKPIFTAFYDEKERAFTKVNQS